MLLLSELLRCRLVDDQKRTARLVDFPIDPAEAEYPAVTGIFWQEAITGSPMRWLPWEEVRAVDAGRRQVRVSTLEPAAAPEAAAPESGGAMERVVLLKRDILDAIIIDLHDRASFLANDLLLEKDGDRLRLKGVDVGIWGMIRRLSVGRIGRSSLSGMRDWKYVEFLRGDPAEARAGLDYHGVIARLPAGEIAYLADLVPYLYAAELVTFLPDELAASTLEKLDPSRQLLVFEELETEQARRLLGRMSPDSVVDLLSRMETETARHLLEHLPREQYRRVLGLLNFPGDTAGGIMTNNIITLNQETSAGKALEEVTVLLRQPSFRNYTLYLYVVENQASGRLRGALMLQELLAAPVSRRVEELMNPYLLTLQPLEKATSAARRVIESGLTSLPVMDNEGKLLGVVTIDTALELTATNTSGRREVLRLFS